MTENLYFISERTICFYAGEGLGDLKDIRAFMKVYEGRVKLHITRNHTEFDRITNVYAGLTAMRSL